MKKRTHTCGELRANNIGNEVVLNGWVDRIRDLGGIKFIMLRDRYGFTQIVFDPENEELYNEALKLGIEYTVSVTGQVRQRPADALNKNMPTGEVEVLATGLEILSASETPPIYVNIDEDTSEELRLKYRYLDLRKHKVQNNLILRHKVAQATREYLNSRNFLEIETPVLTKSTPEGARDFLVPSRLKPGKFYALPQSPQLFKQLLMVSGFDRYYQLAKCYRDEDFRADRQPEFTQIDIEMSFVEQEDVFQLTEGLMKNIFDKAIGYDLKTPLTRLTYADAMETYGSDKPDLRYGMKFRDVSEVFKGSTFGVFANGIENGDVVKAVVAEGVAENFSRKRIDEYTAFAKSQGLGGLVWIKAQAEPKSSIKKWAEEVKKVIEMTEAKDGDMIFLAIGSGLEFNRAFGKIRNKLIEESDKKAEGFSVLWITDFPMFSYNAEEDRLEAEHHPFTMPNLEDFDKYCESEPLKIRSQAYDLVMNGYEIASGSVRIHRKDIQDKVFNLIGLEDEEANSKFGFLLEAFKYGPPPHAGIAPGLDRLVAILAGLPSIRDVIAFPKVASGADLMTEAPSGVSEKQLEELSLKSVKTEK